MSQRDLFGEIVDTQGEREKAYNLSEELSDLIDEMRIDFNNKEFLPFIKKFNRKLHGVDFYNMYWSCAQMCFCKNTDEVKDCLKFDKFNYNEVIDMYKKWKEENHNGKNNI